ncbi:hypothetical protein B7494_g3397 [Chlorociboria aeruginascens]|nr:hypothetical protein B7494_g3397 [Chlorociboria aeruginascens]
MYKSIQRFGHESLPASRRHIGKRKSRKIRDSSSVTWNPTRSVALAVGYMAEERPRTPRPRDASVDTIRELPASAVDEECSGEDERDTVQEMHRETEMRRRVIASDRSVYHHAHYDEKTMHSTQSLYDLDPNFVWENGRRYIGDYYMPIDEDELSRLQLVHRIYFQLFDGELTTVPLRNPSKILDIGTGAGDWAMEMGELWPDAEIIGTDIAKVQPSAVPLNVYFEIEDAEEEGGWTFEENDFDLIHLRNMAGAFTDWKYIYREAFKHLKPGGWIEILDFNDHTDVMKFFNPNSPVPKIHPIVVEASIRSGRPRTTHHLKPQALSDIGFVDVQATDYDIPLGLWPEDPNAKDMGKYWMVMQCRALEPTCLRLLTRWAGWTADEVRKACVLVEEDVKKIAMDREKAAGLAFRFTVLVGRKPGGEEDVRAS